MVDPENQAEVDALIDELVGLTFEADQADDILGRVEPEIERIKERLRELGDEDNC